jgi:hypothetical protein
MNASRIALVLTLAGLAIAPGCGPNRTTPMHMAWGDGGTPPPLGCLPNLDGRIEASELMPAFGTPVSVLVSPPGETRTVDLVGADTGGGTRLWDFGADYATDRITQPIATPIASGWFASSFASDAFYVPYDAGATLVGIYRLDSAGLYLLGLASAQMDPPEGRTLLVYTTPIVVLQLPLVPGASWVSVGEVTNGTVRGLPYAGQDTYTSSVAASGQLVLPQVSFTQAMRVTTQVVVSPAAGASVTRRQSSFVFECFGEVARATSQDGETSDDFTVAGELRRVGR